MLYRIQNLCGRPLRIQRHTGLTFRKFRHAFHASGISLRTLAIRIPARKGITLSDRIRGPCKSRAASSKKLLCAGAAHRVKADITHTVRIAPADADDLLNRLRRKGQRRILPCNDHLRLFRNRPGFRRHGYGVSLRIVGKCGIRKADDKAALLRVIPADGSRLTAL